MKQIQSPFPHLVVDTQWPNDKKEIAKIGYEAESGGRAAWFGL